MSNLTNRLQRLEAAMHPQPLIFVWQTHGETEDAAIARWAAERPGTPEPNPDNVQLIRWEQTQ
jgi:hypothetical protein